ncbi:hypothetical protein [Actinomadura decatromicini]|uniref:Uncharacterized protein n=1 Tax=Actinomadura decatromicini TaxID=2604572 RepID=A0A5D3F329_9ACTN|nr:hypothetical protein [Actinomadura decatromicini]TYK43417.1 hypothetical protein FXF68_38030 [Actinomadura decatromicini]
MPHVAIAMALIMAMLPLPRLASPGGPHPLLDHCESVLRRMPGVIDALNTVNGRLRRVRVRVVLILIISIVVTRLPELWNGTLVP